MNNLTTGSQGSSEPEAGWSDLFSSRYWKGKSKTMSKKYERDTINAEANFSGFYILGCSKPIYPSFVFIPMWLYPHNG